MTTDVLMACMGICCVQVLGTPVEAIIATEDRDIFSHKLAEINESLNPNIICVTVEEAIVVCVHAWPRVRSEYADDADGVCIGCRLLRRSATR